MTNIHKLILVVDDEWMNRDLMESVLQSAGYEVLLANATPLAYQIAVDKIPDLVLLDVRVPTEKEGLQLCRDLKNHPETRRIKIAMITALESETERQLAYAAGADEFMSRMLGVDDFLARIAQLLGD